MDIIPNFISRLRPQHVEQNIFDMGIDSELVIESNISEDLIQIFKCPICLLIPRDIVLLDNCKHHFCSNCICTVATRNLMNFKCPVCRQSKDRITQFDQDPIQQGNSIPFIINQTLNLLKFRCVCAYEGNYLDFLEHERNTCQKIEFKCPAPNCATKVTNETLWEHYKNCEKAILICANPNCCSKFEFRNKMPNHNCQDKDTFYKGLFEFYNVLANPPTNSSEFAELDFFKKTPHNHCNELNYFMKHHSASSSKDLQNHIKICHKNFEFYFPLGNCVLLHT